MVLTTELEPKALLAYFDIFNGATIFIQCQVRVHQHVDCLLDCGDYHSLFRGNLDTFAIGTDLAVDFTDANEAV